MRQVREEGELTINGGCDLSIADLHSPAFEKATTRDRHRIKTLTRLAGVKADATLFHGLLGGSDQFEAVVPHDSLTTDDLVDMAQRVKRAIEREAQRIEEREKTALADARAQASIAESVDTSIEHDDAILQERLESAIKVHSAEKAKLDALLTQREAASDSIAKANAARSRLLELGQGKTVAEATADQTRAKAALDDAESKVKRIELELDAAKATARAAGTAYDAARLAVDQAKREEALHAELHAAINAAGTEAPPEESITDQQNDVDYAARSVASAKEAVTLGVKIRGALGGTTPIGARKRGRKGSSTEKRRRSVTQLPNTADVLTGAIARLERLPHFRIKLERG